MKKLGLLFLLLLTPLFLQPAMAKENESFNWKAEGGKWNVTLFFAPVDHEGMPGEMSSLSLGVIFDGDVQSNSSAVIYLGHVIGVPSALASFNATLSNRMWRMTFLYIDVGDVTAVGPASYEGTMFMETPVDSAGNPKPANEHSPWYGSFAGRKYRSPDSDRASEFTIIGTVEMTPITP